MKPSEQFIYAIKAGCPVVIVETMESPHRVIRMLSLTDGWPDGMKRLSWSIANGIQKAANNITGSSEPLDYEAGTQKTNPKPILADMLVTDESVVMFMLDCDKDNGWFKSLEMLSIVRDNGGEYGAWKRQGNTVVLVVEDESQVPPAVSREAVKIKVPLIDRDMRQAVIRHVVEDTNKQAEAAGHDPVPMPEGADMDRLLNESAGLLSFSVEQACCLSIIHHNKVTPEFMRTEVERSLQRTACLNMVDTGLTFTNVAGFSDLKDFLIRAVGKPQPNPDLRFKGVLVLGVSGAGKSMTAQALAGELGLRCVDFKISSVLGSLVGSSEGKLRDAFATIDAMGKAVVVIDEIEKMLGTGDRDGGVMSRLLGMFLNWLNDRESEAIIYATCNDLSKLPVEFSRAERWDAIYFVDVPDTEQRQALLDIYSSKYGVSYPPKFLAETEGWTGAEVSACFKQAAMLDVPVVEAAKRITPVSVRMGDTLNELRTWASKGATDANTGRPYKRTAKKKTAKKAGGGRQIRRSGEKAD